jgi:uncharacterized alkaline shock family protein YloU
MNKIVRFALILYAFLLSVVSIIALFVIANRKLLEALYFVIYDMVSSVSIRWVIITIAVFLFVFSIVILVYGLSSGRLHKSRIRSNEIGSIDIGVDAIENIVLNTAKTSQCGIKTAKARVFSAKEGKIRVEVTTVVFSDVEIPAMMAKVQDRIKKDIERYTGIPVLKVKVKVSRVEAITAKVER